MFQEKLVSMHSGKIVIFSIFFIFRLRAEEHTNVHLNPIKVLHELEDNMDDNSILVAGMIVCTSYSPTSEFCPHLYHDSNFQ